MPKDEWGVKRLCPSCATRFYDLQRDPMTCPNCGAVFDLDSLLSKKTGSRVEKKEAEPRRTTARRGDEDDNVVLDDEDNDSDVDIDDDLLDDEDDDDDDDVNLDDIADVAKDEDEN